MYQMANSRASTLDQQGALNCVHERSEEQGMIDNDDRSWMQEVSLVGLVQHRGLTPRSKKHLCRC